MRETRLIMIPVADLSLKNVGYLNAALGSLLPYLEDGWVHVNLNTTEGDRDFAQILKPWLHLAGINRNRLTHMAFDAETSLARMNVRALHYLKHKKTLPPVDWWINFDVDLLATPQWLRWIKLPWPDRWDLLLYNRVDVQDWGFPGWTTAAHSQYDFKSVLEEHGEHGLIYRRWLDNADTYVTVKNAWTGGFALNLPRSGLLHAGLLTDKLLAFAKGERGYDRVVCQHFADKTAVALGTLTWHTGINPLLGEGSNWTTVKDEEEWRSFSTQAG